MTGNFEKVYKIYLNFGNFSFHSSLNHIIKEQKDPINSSNVKKFTFWNKFCCGWILKFKFC